MIDFRVFIASSLGLTEYRQSVIKAVDRLNVEGTAEGQKFECNFSVYNYEGRADQRLKDIGAQNAVNAEIGKSAFFFMIVDGGVIGEATIEEFRVAKARCFKHQYPVYIMLFVNKESQVISPQKGQFPFDKFAETELRTSKFLDNKIVVDNLLIYYYPFTKAEEIENKVVSEIRNWYSSPYRPLLDAKLGCDIKQEDIYKDRTRRDNCKSGLYFKRDFDDNLLSSLQEGLDIVYIYGESLSGKTRAVYRAIEKMPNSWFYVLPYPGNCGGVELCDQKIKDLQRYLSQATLEQNLYLLIDDYDRYDIPELRDSLSLLYQNVNELNRRQQNQCGCTVIITSSTPRDGLDEFSFVDIKIPPMSQEQYEEAIQYFRRYISNIELNRRYRTTGAILINLDSISTKYSNYVRQKAGVSNNRKNLLTAIKALSIWRASYLGDIDIIYDFWRYLTGDTTVDGTAFSEMIDDLVRECPGIILGTHNYGAVSGRVLDVQEYIYRYILDYNGMPLTNNDDRIVDRELDLAYKILSYTKRTNAPVIVDLAKIMNRCEHRNEVAVHFFEVFQTGVTTRKINADWVEQLIEEKNAIENGIFLDHFTEDTPVYYPKIFKQRIYECASFKEALDYYLKAKESLRDLYMLGALISKATTEEDMVTIVGLREYIRMKDHPFIVQKAIQKCTTYTEACELFRRISNFKISVGSREVSIIDDRFNVSPQAVDIYINIVCSKGIVMKPRGARFLLTSDEYDFMLNVSHYKQCLNVLFGLVASQSEMQQVCSLLRNSYIFFVNQQVLANRYKGIKVCPIDVSALSILDLLDCVDIFVLRKAFVSLSAINGSTEEKLEMMNRCICFLKDAIPNTQFTPRHRIRVIIANIANKFISHFNKEHFKGVYDQIFVHLEDKQRELIFRDAYTYSGMLEMKDASMMESLNLFYKFIEPHTRDHNNFFMVNVFILNALYSKAIRYCSKVENVENYAYVREVEQLFDYYGVERDTYSYNQQLKYLSFEEGLSLYEAAFNEGRIQPDAHTYGTLIEKAKDFNTALAFFNVDGIHAAYNDYGDFVSSQHYSWKCLFEKPCASDANDGSDDRQTISDCLDYLEKNRPELLVDGKLYNVCLNNRTYIRNYSEAQMFIRKRGFRVDSFTLKHCIEILAQENSPKAHSSIVSKANELILSHKELLLSMRAEDRCKPGGDDRESFVYNIMLRLYLSHIDPEPFVFINSDGTVDQKARKPLEYVKKMRECGITVDKFTLLEFLKISTSMSEETIRGILSVCEECKIQCDSDMVRKTEERYARVMWESVRNGFEQLIHENSPEKYNKHILKLYEEGKIETITEAFDRVVGSYKTVTYNDLLSIYLRKQKSNGNIGSDTLFHTAWNEVYRNQILASVRPNIDTFSLLASVATDSIQLGDILQEIERLNQSRLGYDLKISEEIFQAYVGIAQDWKSLRDNVEAFITDGIDISSFDANYLLKRIVSIANSESDNQSDASLAVTQFVDYLFKHSLDDYSCCFSIPLFDRYEQKEGITSDTIVGLLGFKRLSEIIPLVEMFECLVTYYPSVFMGKNELVDFLGDQASSPMYLEQIFSALNQANSKDISAFRQETLCAAFNTLSEPGNAISYDEYCKLIQIYDSGDYTVDQHKAIAAGIINYLFNNNSMEEASIILDGIIKNIADNSYVGKLTISSFLLEENANLLSREKEEVTILIKDFNYDLLPFINTVLLRRIEAEKFKGLNVNAIIKEFETFLSRHILHYKKFEKMCWAISDVNIFNRLLPLIYKNAQCTAVLLTQMSLYVYSYSRLSQLIHIAYRYNIDYTKQFMSVLAHSVAASVYKDSRLSKVYKQILYGIRNDDLRLYHFLVGDDILMQCSTRSIELLEDKKVLLFLCSDIYKSESLSQACDLIIEYYRRANVKDRDKDKNFQLIILNYLALCCRRAGKKFSGAKKEEKVRLTELVKNLYVSDTRTYIDVSVLFDGEMRTGTSVVEILTELGVELMIPPQALDYAIFNNLDISDNERVALIPSAKHFLFWLRSLDTTEEVLNLLLLAKEKSLDYVKMIIIASLEKVDDLENFKKILRILDEYDRFILDEKIRRKLFVTLLSFIRSEFSVFRELHKVDLRKPFRLFDLNRLIPDLGLMSHAEIPVPKQLQIKADLTQLYKEWDLFYKIFNCKEINSLNKILIKYHAGASGEQNMVTVDFLLCRILNINDVKGKIIHDICNDGKFNLSYLATDGIPSKMFNVKMTSNIMDSLFASISGSSDKKGISIIDLFCMSAETLGTSYFSSQNLYNVIRSIKGANDYIRFMNTVHLHELELDGRNRVALANFLHEQNNKYKDRTDKTIRQIYSCVVTHTLTNNLRYGHFCAVDASGAKFNIWANTLIDNRELLQLFSKLPLAYIICNCMYNLKDRYHRSLMILANYKKQNSIESIQKIPGIQKIYYQINKYESEYIERIGHNDVGFWDLDRVRRLWIRLPWLPSRQFLLTFYSYCRRILRDEVDLSGETNKAGLKIVVENKYVNPLRSKVAFVESRGFPEVRISLKDFAYDQPSLQDSLKELALCFKIQDIKDIID